MFLTEILDIHLSDLHEALSDDEVLNKFMDLSVGFSERKPKSFRQIVTYADAVMRRFPEVRYQGRMFRALTIEGNELMQMESNEVVIRYLKANATKSSNNGYASWSKTPEDCIAFMNDFRRPGTDGGGEWETPESRKVIGQGSETEAIVIIEQQSYGLSYKALLNMFRESPQGDKLSNLQQQMLNMTGSVDEILAPYSDTVRVGFYVIEGTGRKVRSDNQQMYSDGKYADRQSFSANQFQQMKEVLSRSLDYKTMKKRPFSEPYHPDSVYKNTNIDSMSMDQRVKDAEQRNKEIHGSKRPRSYDF